MTQDGNFIKSIRFICDKELKATDTSHKQYKSNYKKCTGNKDKQAYDASYKTTQNINIV